MTDIDCSSSDTESELDDGDYPEEIDLEDESTPSEVNNSIEKSEYLDNNFLLFIENYETDALLPAAIQGAKNFIAKSKLQSSDSLESCVDFMVTSPILMMIKEHTENAMGEKIPDIYNFLGTLLKIEVPNMSPTLFFQNPDCRNTQDDDRLMDQKQFMKILDNLCLDN